MRGASRANGGDIMVLPSHHSCRTLFLVCVSVLSHNILKAHTVLCKFMSMCA